MKKTTTRRPTSRADDTHYSEWIDGDAGNYGWRVKFDLNTDGYLGIVQPSEPPEFDRVLLCPSQVRALRRFLA